VKRLNKPQEKTRERTRRAKLMVEENPRRAKKEKPNPSHKAD